VSKLLLCLHVLAALLAIGPVAVAASMFPTALRRAHRDPGDREALATLRVLHRICRVYAAIGIAVPVLGLATASSLGVLGSGWLIASILLTAAAAAILALLILPGQDSALAAAQVPGSSPGTRSPPPSHAHRRLQPAVGHGHHPDDRPPRLHHRSLTVSLRHLRIAAHVAMGTGEKVSSSITIPARSLRCVQRRGQAHSTLVPPRRRQAGTTWLPVWRTSSA
jgi:hypothetical protein